jgi:hypothetical protein
MENYHPFPFIAWLLIAAVCALGALVALVIAALLFTVTPARPHDALPTAAQPQGWKYPFSCCSGFDCRKVGTEGSGAKVTVAETPHGYKISTTGEVIAYGDKRIKDSPDGDFHWCSVAGADDSRTICLFVPPPAI